jgi:hypothetical protein
MQEQRGNVAQLGSSGETIVLCPHLLDVGIEPGGERDPSLAA